MKTAALLLFSFISLGDSLPTGCELNPFISNAPLIIDPGTTGLIHPQPGNNTLKFSRTANVEFSCPGGQIITNGVSLGTSVLASCKTGETFKVNGETVVWSTISCSNNDMKPDVKELKISELHDDNPNIQCLNTEKTLRIIQIGFTLDKNRFLGVIDICFNSTAKLPVYSYYNLSASINNRARNVANPSFRQDDIFYRMGRSIQRMYRNNQTTINNIIGLHSASDKYINRRTFLNRGHLAAKADFVYEPLQKATYRYINVVPQWNTFNGGNWNQIETDVRNYADKNKLNLQVWTGIYGNSVLPNENTLEPENLYLYIDETDKKNSPAFPVPEVFWKVVYEPIAQKGIVLVGHNNPYKNITRLDEMLCNGDVSHEITWLNGGKNQKNTRRGFSYACHCNDTKFRGLVSVVPMFRVKGLLV